MEQQGGVHWEFVESGTDLLQAAGFIFAIILEKQTKKCVSSHRFSVRQSLYS
jgi:hypothetical protein